MKKLIFITPCKNFEITNKSPWNDATIRAIKNTKPMLIKLVIDNMAQFVSIERALNEYGTM